tara:strand:- start:8588 stop:9208 length:621 start_codon:yes stop_codon:yes gene_type:complete
MGLSVIGAGFGRTGTESLKNALEILGYGPCYHMFEVLPYPERVATWRAIASGEKPDWDHVFSGFGATVDWPGASYWRELSRHFPKAKIVLSIRDADSWYDSMDNTILPILRNSDDMESIGIKVISERVFAGKINDREHMIDVFNKNIAEIQAAFGTDRLLTYQLGSGWEPLCQFLGCEIPDEPYPFGNSSEQFEGKVAAVTNTPSG